MQTTRLSKLTVLVVFSAALLGVAADGYTNGGGEPPGSTGVPEHLQGPATVGTLTFTPLDPLNPNRPGLFIAFEGRCGDKTVSFVRHFDNKTFGLLTKDQLIDARLPNVNQFPELAPCYGEIVGDLIINTVNKLAIGLVSATAEVVVLAVVPKNSP